MFNQIMYNIKKPILKSTAPRTLNSTIQMDQVSTPKTHLLLQTDRQALATLSLPTDKHLQTQEEESVMVGLTRHSVTKQRKSFSLLTKVCDFFQFEKSLSQFLLALTKSASNQGNGSCFFRFLFESLAGAILSMAPKMAFLKKK